jgi:hypothetical protein
MRSVRLEAIETRLASRPRLVEGTLASCSALHPAIYRLQADPRPFIDAMAD